MNEQPPDDGADAALDQALLAHDEVRTAYVLRNRAFRRRVAIYLLIVFLAGGSAMIAYGLLSDAAARRLAEIGNIVGTFMVSIAGLLSAYFGAGAFDNRTMYGGGLYGGGSGMGVGFGGSSPAFGGFNSAALRPRLTKTPTAAGAPPAPSA